MHWPMVLWATAACWLLASPVVLAFESQTVESFNEHVVSQLLDLVGHKDPCLACKTGLSIMKKALAFSDDVLPPVIDRLCKDPVFNKSKLCGMVALNFTMVQVDFDQTDHGDPHGIDHSTFASDLSHAIKLMDPHDLDYDYYCNFFILEACPLPAPPDFDLTSWWPEKPKDLVVDEASDETFTVLHLSDFHLQSGYTPGAEADCLGAMCCEGNSVGSRFPYISEPAPLLGHYKCDSPELLIQRSLESVVDHSTITGLAHDFTIFTGDMVDHDPILISYEKSLQEEEAVFKNLKQYLGDIPVYPVLGNHDTYPFAQIAQQSSGYANLFDWNTNLMAHLWQENGWLDPQTSLDLQSHYGAYAVTTKRGLRVISLNSNFWYAYNFYNYWNTSDPDTSGMLRFLSDELVACEKKGQRAWIIAHVPLGSAVDVMPVTSEAFNQIVERFSPETIAALFFGHTHKDEFQVVYAGNATEKSSDNSVNVAWIAQSITPLVGLNPSWRYYQVDSKTFSIVNSFNYYTPLNSTMQSNSSIPTWYYEYSARDAYDPQGKWPQNAPLNATFWHQVAQNIKSDPIAAQKYLDFSYRHTSYTPDCSTKDCMMKNYCFVTSFSASQAVECLRNLE